MNEQLQPVVTYIQKQLQIGQSPDEISQQLVTAGWPTETVQQAFQAVQAQVLPTTMQQSQPVTGTAATTVPPQAAGQRRGRLRNSWLLFKRSMQILNDNRYLFRYMWMTWAIIIAVEAIIFCLVYFGGNLFFKDDDSHTVQGWILTVVSYVVTYFIINFYAAALTSNIFDIFRGQKQPYATYIGKARAKAWPIFLFSVIEAIVGMFLRFVVERIRFVGWFIAWLLGTAWSLGTMFVLPLIVDADMSATTSIKESIKFFKKTWGENVLTKLTVNTPLALLTIAVWAVFFPLLFVTISSGSTALVIALIIIYLFIQISIAILGSFANNVINVALYYYATTQTIPPGFSSDMLNQVFVQRKHFRKGKKDQAAA